jgi:hypothetical protein
VLATTLMCEADFDREIICAALAFISQNMNEQQMLAEMDKHIDLVLMRIAFNCSFAAVD